MITKAKLEKLSEDCKELLFYSEKLESNNTERILECNRSIKHALRKIIIANEISDRMVICITGLQGTGKTTLMKNFYGLNDDVMNIALGRGERLPVFITEKNDIRDIELYAVGIEKQDNSYHTVKKLVSNTEFVELSKGEDEDTTIMYMEILVPQKYMNCNNNISYMLLPGYEQNNDIWNALIEFSVNCSNTAIFTMTPSSIAGNANSILLQEIKEKFGDNIIYAITQSDASDDDNTEYKETLMKSFEINDSNRVVCTGAYTDNKKNEQWKQQLRNAIDMFALSPSNVDSRNLEYIDEIILGELRPRVVEIKKFVTDITEALITGFENSSLLDAFDKTKEKMKKQLEGILKSKFKVALDLDDGQLMKNINSRNIFGVVKRSLFGESTKDIEKSKEIIDNSMKDDKGRYRYMDAFSASVCECVDLLCIKDVEEDKQHKAIEMGNKNINTLLVTKSNEEKQLILRDVTSILSNSEKKEVLISNNPLETVRTIVEIGTQYYGLIYADALCSKAFIDTTNLKFEKSGLSKDSLKSNIKSTELFAIEILGITGLDLMKDGVINFIPAFAESLAVSVPVATGIVGVVVGFGAAQSIIKDYNKIQIADYYSYKKVICSIYDDVRKEYLDIYDNYMDSLRFKIEQYLINCMGENKAVINKQNTIIAINNILNDLDDICKDLRDDSYELTKIIR